MDKLRMQSLDKTKYNVEKLKELFPNAVTEVQRDGKTDYAIDFDILKQELSSELVEGREERYQFTWPGKREAILLANSPTTKTLRPCKEESVDFDNTQNLYIEGDNLEVLKLLQEPYLGKVKMIYIDPPYNTGNDFIYNDSFTQSKELFEKATGVRDEEGNRLFQNTESNGRFHSDWCSMIYPRLKLAKDLLSDDGVIFISIDDNEQENLKKICDDVFGEGQFVALFPWRKRTAKSDVPFGVSQDYEWILCYAKSDGFRASVKGKGRKYYETPDLPGRPWRTHEMTSQKTATERPNCYFTMINPKTGDKFPCDSDNTWRVSKDTFQEYYDAKKIIFPGDYPFLNIKKPVMRYFKADDIKKAGEDFGRVAVSTKFPDAIGMSQDGTKEIKELFNNIIFSHPKPTSLMKFLIEVATKPDSIVLDFFSGSATTAHAVMQLNAEDGGNRKFIVTQVPEKCDEGSEAAKAGYKNICEIGKERIRRAGKKILEYNTSVRGSLDIGFRVLKLDSSNMEDVYYDPASSKQGELSIVNVKADRTSLDLLFQVMLEFDKPLSSKIEETEICGKTVFKVDGDDMICCFDEGISDELVKEITQLKPLYAIFRDSSFADDSVRVNCDQLFAKFSPKTVYRVI